MQTYFSFLHNNSHSQVLLRMHEMGHPSFNMNISIFYRDAPLASRWSLYTQRMHRQLMVTTPQQTHKYSYARAMWIFGISLDILIGTNAIIHHQRNQQCKPNCCAIHQLDMFYHKCNEHLELVDISQAFELRNIFFLHFLLSNGKCSKHINVGSKVEYVFSALYMIKHTLFSGYIVNVFYWTAQPNMS